MIYDNEKNIGRYKSTSWIYNCINRVCDYTDETIPVGKYEIKGDGIKEASLYAVVNSYVTHPHISDKYENHHDWVDIQYILDGEEEIRVCRKDDLPVAREYEKDADYEFLCDPESYTSVAMKKGDFLVLLPGEAHEPNLSLKGESSVRKIVFKVKVADYEI